ncbi:hypothetical protein GCM10010885_17550 [Alicyclobacillus cellulosilyticus]|uniref:Spore cortex biosynthesis protein YabQ n=1 Tax=Alicyclobacillus cellulosilyticus TaxID=1003997 RepID=A0A917NMF4_9BACL|nr:spore cortex biosynthesis protein YabQ [Alicyclobacillus cellulosilyticus]GGJ08961.1 hypothetical protein GCM10010885_17550 [Alicyclobacillus cellulosilyticus]
MAAQFQYVLAMFFSAWLLGAVFDVYNTVMGASAWLRWLRPAADLAFWLGGAGFVYVWMYITDDGRFRVYALLLLAAGYLVYRMTLHRPVVASAWAVVRAVAFLLRWVWRLLEGVVIRPLRGLAWVVAWVLRWMYRWLVAWEDMVFFLLGFMLRPVVWVFATPWRRTANLRAPVARGWEGFWARVANWLRKNPGS